MISCEVAHNLYSVPIKIARVRSEVYTDGDYASLFDTGSIPIDAIISPEREVAKSFTRLVAVPGAKDLISFDNDLLRLIQITLSEDCPVLHTPLNQLTELFPDLGARVIYIVRNEEGIVPKKLDQM